MSEMSDIRMGLCCAICESYFVKGHGYPVLCEKCWGGADDDAREFHGIASHDLRDDLQ
jgi:hypothetical protein